MRLQSDLEHFIKDEMQKSGKIVPARIQAALALLERLRDCPSLFLTAHHTPGSSGAISHETYGNRALERLKLERINKNHGRRSSNLPQWGQELLDIIGRTGFETAAPEKKAETISEAQDSLAKVLKALLEEQPLEARLKGRSAEAVIHEILLQAEVKRKSGEVAQYLVGAKLSIRFKKDLPVVSSNKSDRKSYFDQTAKSGDFEIGNTVIEVAVGPPDEKHLDQIADILSKTDEEVWLLTRSDRVASWKNEVLSVGDIDFKRIVITSVEAFVGQNISELGEFSTKGKASSLGELFQVYNETWVKQVGTPGIRIVLK